MDRDPLSEKVIKCAMIVHSRLGPGFLESVYHRALAIELAKVNISFELERAVAVFYDGAVIGEFACDVIVESKLLLELKAVQALTAAHEVQIVNYLTATKFDVGLLINFGAASLQFKRKFRRYQPPRRSEV
jgi:GxxExxY protein